MRIVLEHTNSDYADCASRLLDKVPLRKKIGAVCYAFDEVEVQKRNTLTLMALTTARSRLASGMEAIEEWVEQ